MEKDYFIFDDINSLDFGAWLTGEGVFNAPERKTRSVEIPGRNGALTIDEGISFEEIKHTYPGFIAENFAENVRSLRSALLSKAGKCRLSDTYNPDEFYLARCSGGIKVKPAPRAVAGEFEIEFIRDPRRFLVSGEVTQTYASGSKIYNPTEYDARPEIRIYGYGTVGIGGNTITIASNSKAYIDINSEIMDCYFQTENLNSLISFSQNDFPVLKPGLNGINYSGNITRVDIKPNWWRI